MNLSTVKKAIGAFVSAGFGSLALAATPMSDSGATIVLGEYATALSLAIVAAVGVYWTPKNTERGTDI